MSLLEERVVVLVTGISASGKSTVADGLARRFRRGVHVKGDLFRRMVVAGRAEMTPPSEEAWAHLRLRYELGAATADRYFDAGFSVVVQDVVIGPVLQEYVDLIRSRPLCVVVLVPSTEVVARREAARPKVAYADGSYGLHELDTALRTETPTIGLWLDSSAQTPDETVDEVVARAWDLRLR